MPDDQDAPKTPSPENQTVHTYSFPVYITLLPGTPTILDVEINADLLPDALGETLFQVMRRGDPDFENKMIEEFDARDWDEAKTLMAADTDYLEGQDLAVDFFIRNISNLTASIYNITALMSVIHAIRRSAEQTDNQLEETTKIILRAVLRDLGRDIKRMLETRSKGRPPKTKSPVYGAPEIARQVWEIACGLMGERRGEKAVPRLKEVANIIGKSQGALGKQLTRSKWPWAQIKKDLADRT